MMKLLLVLLLHSYSAFSAFASSLAPDISARNAGITTYTITAVDRANTYYTEELLKNTFGKSNIVTQRHNGIFMSWKVTSPNSQLAGALRALDGVQTVSSVFEPQDRTHHVLRARDAGNYMVAPREGSDTKKTEEFLKIQIQPDTTIRTVMAQEDVLAWFNVWLSPEAKQAVEDHEGVLGVQRELEVMSF